MSAALRHVVGGLASLWLTLASLAAAAAIALTGEIGVWPIGLPMAIPFAVLCLNLLAALAISPKLRRQGGLLGFHLALAALALLAALDRLMALSGHVEVTEGTAFDARLVQARAGPLHPWGLDAVRFVQGEFVVRYATGMKRRETVSAVLVPGGEGGWLRREVGDDRPLVTAGYRFYTSFNKGFAPVLTYVDSGGDSHSGAIHLPSYPLNDYRQGNAWRLPGDEARTVKLWLHLPEPVHAADTRWEFRKPEDAVLVVIDGDGRREIRPGQTMTLGQGRLRYDELRSWMGYTISYSPLAPWMLAATVTGVLCLTWHIAGKLWRTPWLPSVQQEVGSGHG